MPEITESNDLTKLWPDPAGIDPKVRQKELYAYRRRVNAGEELSTDELNHALLLLRTERASRMGRIPKGKSKTKEPQADAFDLSDF